MSQLVISLITALRGDHPRAIDRYIDYFGEGGGLGRPAPGPGRRRGR
jgi:hypothetical protein